MKAISLFFGSQHPVNRTKSRRNAQQIRRVRGLTLAELLVVLAILAAITAVVYPLITNGASTAATTTQATNVQTVKGTYHNYLSAGGVANYTTDATAMLSAAGWSGTATMGSASVNFVIPQVTGLMGADGKTGSTATTAAQLATLLQTP